MKWQNEYNRINFRGSQSNGEDVDIQASNYITMYLVNKYLFSIYYILDMRLGTRDIAVNTSQIPALRELTIQKMIKCVNKEGD